MRSDFLSQKDILTFQKDGVVLIKGLFSDFLDQMSDGIEKIWQHLENTPLKIQTLMKREDFLTITAIGNG
tara:strand:+ start:148 stop:357 length:210 start_codon:yes stop_codon:yes gene_type:complete